MIELLEQYDHIDGFHEGLAAVWTKEGIGFIDIYGEMAISPRYEKIASENGLDEVYRFSEGVSVFLQNGQYGIIDKWGYTVVSADYNHISPLQEFMASAQLGEKWGFISNRGKVFIPFVYDFAQSFFEGFSWVKQNMCWGCIDQSGQVVIPFSKEYYSVNPFHCSVSVFSIIDKDNNCCRYGVIDKNGDTIIEPSYSYISNYHENLAYTSQKTYIDTSGKTILLLPQYYHIRKFSNGRAFVQHNGKWGAIARTGELIIPTIYDECRDFHNNYAAIKKDMKWGYIDNNGELVLPIIYDYVSEVENGYAIVRKKNKWMIIKIA